MSLVVITPFIGVNYTTFLPTNLSIEMNAKINAKIMSFFVILTAQNRFIGLKKSFLLVTPMPKFLNNL
jgi:hypothetical protein